MISCQLAICAERVIRDAATGNVSVIGIIDQFTVENFPVVLKFMCLIIFDREEDDPMESTLEARFRLGEGEIFKASEGFSFEGGIRKRHIITIEGLPVDRPGGLRMEVLREGEAAASWLIHIAKVKDPQLRLQLPEDGPAEE